ncbi:MAG: methyltransferase [Candidatus Uhrbacteria bacterium]|nr:methyltransferase [Candidatus Uhrbacteria bacterium]
MYYFSTFISGFQDIVKSLIGQMLKDVEIVNIFDGIVLYKTSATPETIRTIKIFNNSFMLLARYQIPVDKTPDYLVKQFLGSSKDIGGVTQSEIDKGRYKTFRVVSSHRNQLYSTDRVLLKKVEEKIMQCTNISVDRLNPDVEFWFLTRSEGTGLFGMRITKHKSYDKVLQRGELRPELANLMCWLSEPSSDDVFLDPFCGYGSIPFERSSIAGYRKIMASDTDREKLRIVTTKLQSTVDRSKAVVSADDFFKISVSKDLAINKIVTDPPWGEYEKMSVETVKFYEEFLGKCSELLTSGGILVFISSCKLEVDEALRKLPPKLVLEQSYDILVSGKKARIYRFTNS